MTQNRSGKHCCAADHLLSVLWEAGMAGDSEKVVMVQ